MGVEKMPSCEGQVTEMMSLALDGLLEEAGRERLQQHLESCPACQAEWEAMQAVSALLEGSAPVGPPLGFALRVERKLAARERKRRQAFGGLALVTSSLSLAALTAGAVCLLVLGLVVWQWAGDQPSVQLGIEAASQVASGMGLMGKGTSLFLGDVLLRFGTPLLFALGAGVTVLVALWTWCFVRRPQKTPHNGTA